LLESAFRFCWWKMMVLARGGCGGCCRCSFSSMSGTTWTDVGGRVKHGDCSRLKATWLLEGGAAMLMCCRCVERRWRCCLRTVAAWKRVAAAMRKMREDGGYRCNGFHSGLRRGSARRWWLQWLSFSDVKASMAACSVRRWWCGCRWVMPWLPAWWWWERRKIRIRVPFWEMVTWQCMVGQFSEWRIMTRVIMWLARLISGGLSDDMIWLNGV